MERCVDEINAVWGSVTYWCDSEKDNPSYRDSHYLMKLSLSTIKALILARGIISNWMISAWRRCVSLWWAWQGTEIYQHINQGCFVTYHIDMQTKPCSDKGVSRSSSSGVSRVKLSFLTVWWGFDLQTWNSVWESCCSQWNQIKQTNHAINLQHTITTYTLVYRY